VPGDAPAAIVPLLTNPEAGVTRVPLPLIVPPEAFIKFAPET